MGVYADVLQEVFLYFTYHGVGRIIDIAHIVFDALTEQARQALGAERFNALFDEGRALTLEEAVADVHLYLGLPDDFAPDQTDGERTNAGG